MSGSADPPRERSIFRVSKKHMTNMPMPNSSPGITPPKSSLPTERFVSMAMNTIGMLGGMIGPTTAAEALSAAEKSSG